MTTLARPTTSQSSHWYFPDGTPCHTVKCTTKDGDRPTTIADARKLGLLPSVTNILSCLRKPALESWKIEQACLSVLTAPRKEDEALDAFVQRVLHDERQHEQEARDAADLGTRIHKALQDELSGRIADHGMLPWVEPVWEFLNGLAPKAIETEKVLVGDGYAGRTDLIATFEGWRHVIDFKTTKTIPTKGAYWEHQMQTAAYAKALNLPLLNVRTANIYISTTDPGKLVMSAQEDWLDAWEAFAHLRDYWQIDNDFH